MWIYNKIKGGYVRELSIGHEVKFMYNVLTDKQSRSIWRKLVGKTWCRLLRHDESGVIIGKGYTSAVGSFKVEMCKNCHAGILFHERRSLDEFSR